MSNYRILLQKKDEMKKEVSNSKYYHRKNFPFHDQYLHRYFDKKSPLETSRDTL